MALRIGIVGAGNIGGKRAAAIKATRKGVLVAVADHDFDKAKELAGRYGAAPLNDWKKLVARKDIDVVIVAVPNAFTKPIVIGALAHKKHVLCEKPFGVSSKESLAMIRAAKKAKTILKLGFNHRFQAAVMKAHEMASRGMIGKVLFIRARYGHGGRAGMEKEWRFKKNISGGGELLDQGVHVIDLARWFAGEVTSVQGLAETKFWKTNLEDNAFALLSSKTATTSMHVSATQWKNIFSIEVFGEKGFLQIEGKGGGYGEEMLTYGKRVPGAAPILTVFRFGLRDRSWEREWDNFAGAVQGRGRIIGTMQDGLRANQIVEAIYKASRLKKAVKVKLTR